MQQLELIEVEFEDIVLNSNGFTNGRTHIGDISTLKKSIEENGLMDPLVVWDSGEELVLVAGYRRYAALEQLREEISEESFKTLIVSLCKGNLEEALAKNIEENIQRKNLNPADEAQAVSNLYDKVGDQTTVGSMLGMSQGWVSNRVNLYKGLIPRALDYLRMEKINLTQATKLSKLVLADGSPDEHKQNKFLDSLDNEEDPQVEKPERKKTYRTKKEFEELALTLAEAKEDGSLTDLHAATIERVVAWHRCEIDMDALLYEEVEIGEEDELTEEEIIVEAPVQTRRRRTAQPAQA